MKRSIFAIFLMCLVTSLFMESMAQQCYLKPPVLKVDFGSGRHSQGSNFSLVNYDRINGECPQDGSYSLASYTSNCFNDHWVTVNQDHTPGDSDGKMLLVNASYTPGLFFIVGLDNLLPNTIYELGVWLVNVCKPDFDCTGLKPNIRFIVEDASGIVLAKFSTGEIQPTGAATWEQYSARFTTPATNNRLLLKIINKSEGGCGNDFAMDDITVRECVISKPEVKPAPKPKPEPRVVTRPVPTRKPVLKQPAPVNPPTKKDEPVLARVSVKDSMVLERAVPKNKPSFVPAPTPILLRANPVVKRIETAAAEAVIDLYDNGDIDGDTVSIYHNNVLIVSRAALSAKPISFRFRVDPGNSHHELVMVANNLGSIPPNTSLMVVTAANKRYEVFISSSEQKNAKVVIDLKE